MPLAMRICLSRLLGLRRSRTTDALLVSIYYAADDSDGFHRGTPEWSAHPRADRAEPVKLGPIVLTRADVDRRVQRTGHDELPGAQVSAQRVQGLDQPGHGLQRVAQRGGA